MKGKSRGFTLIEVMVVVVILGLLAAMIAPKVLGRPDEARAAAARHDVAVLLQSLKLYKLDHKRYPDAAQGLQILAARSSESTGSYIERLPEDPWGRPYQYLNPGLHGEVDLWSLGADGQPGGEGADADIGSWLL